MFFSHALHIEITGVDSSEWTTLFNGQLDDGGMPDPMMGVQNTDPSTAISVPPYNMDVANCQQQRSPAGIDRWFMEETHKLERQQRVQQQKLLELQQVIESLVNG